MHRPLYWLPIYDPNEKLINRVYKMERMALQVPLKAANAPLPACEEALFCRNPARQH